MTMSGLPRIYIVFRGDLPEMTRAKGEVQAAHAAASLIYMGLNTPGTSRERVIEYMEPTIHDRFVKDGQAKIVMEVVDKDALTEVFERALVRDVPVVCIQDAAHTVFAEPTVTCLAFGPCSKTDGNAITRGAWMRM